LHGVYVACTPARYVAVFRCVTRALRFVATTPRYLDTLRLVYSPVHYTTQYTHTVCYVHIRTLHTWFIYCYPTTLTRLQFICTFVFWFWLLHYARSLLPVSVMVRCTRSHLRLLRVYSSTGCSTRLTVVYYTFCSHTHIPFCYVPLRSLIDVLHTFQFGSPLHIAFAFACLHTVTLRCLWFTLFVCYAHILFHSTLVHVDLRSDLPHTRFIHRSFQLFALLHWLRLCVTLYVHTFTFYTRFLSRLRTLHYTFTLRFCTYTQLHHTFAHALHHVHTRCQFYHVPTFYVTRFLVTFTRYLPVRFYLLVHTFVTYTPTAHAWLVPFIPSPHQTAHSAITYGSRYWFLDHTHGYVYTLPALPFISFCWLQFYAVHQFALHTHASLDCRAHTAVTRTTCCAGFLVLYADTPAHAYVLTGTTFHWFGSFTGYTRTLYVLGSRYLHTPVYLSLHCRYRCWMPADVAFPARHGYTRYAGCWLFYTPVVTLVLPAAHCSPYLRGYTPIPTRLPRPVRVYSYAHTRTALRATFCGLDTLPLFALRYAFTVPARFTARGSFTAAVTVAVCCHALVTTRHVSCRFTYRLDAFAFALRGHIHGCCVCSLRCVLVHGGLHLLYIPAHLRARAYHAADAPAILLPVRLCLPLRTSIRLRTTFVPRVIDIWFSLHTLHGWMRLLFPVLHVFARLLPFKGCVYITLVLPRGNVYTRLRGLLHRAVHVVLRITVYRNTGLFFAHGYLRLRFSWFAYTHYRVQVPFQPDCAPPRYDALFCGSGLRFPVLLQLLMQHTTVRFGLTLYRFQFCASRTHLYRTRVTARLVRSFACARLHNVRGCYQLHACAFSHHHTFVLVLVDSTVFALDSTVWIFFYALPFCVLRFFCYLRLRARVHAFVGSFPFSPVTQVRARTHYLPVARCVLPRTRLRCLRLVLAFAA